MPRKGENIYKRKDGRWEGRYKCGITDTGHTKYRSVYARSYQEVKEKLMKLKTQPINYKSPGKLTVNELFSEWLNATKLKVKATSYSNYLMKAEKHILPAFGSFQYEKLTPDMLHNFIDNKIKLGLSAKYVCDIIIVFKTMSKYISRIYGFKNPLENVILPKSGKKEIELLDKYDQSKLVETLLNNTDNTKLGVLLSYYTGLRIGELCGLKWSDINFEKNILTVNRTVQRISNKKDRASTQLYIGSPKSISSKREIPLPDFIMSLLYNKSSKSDSYLLSGTIKVIEPRTMQYRFKSILKKACLPSVNFHSLRHMFATNCIRLGFDIKTLSEILGHSSVETTLNRYVHSSLDRKCACMNLLSIAA